MRKILLLLLTVVASVGVALAAEVPAPCCACPPPRKPVLRAPHAPVCKPCPPCDATPTINVNVPPQAPPIVNVTVPPAPVAPAPEIRNVYIPTPTPRHGEWSLPISALYIHEKGAGAIGLDYQWPNGWALGGSVLIGSEIRTGDVTRSTLIHDTTTIRACGLGGHGHDDHGDDDDDGNCIPAPPVTRRTTTTSVHGSHDEASQYGAILTLRIPLNRR